MSELPDSDIPAHEDQQKKPAIDGQTRAKSYGIGCVMLLIGIGMIVGFFFVGKAPSKLFYLLVSGGVAMLLSGVGLFIHPLDDEQMESFQNNPNIVATFQIMPVFWKVWLLVIGAAMIGAFYVVSQLIVRV